MRKQFRTISMKNGTYFASETFQTHCEKKRSSDQEKVLKFEGEDPEFAKSLR